MVGPGFGLEREREGLAEALPAFELGEVIGRGAFGTVYAARHVRLEREVAIKRLSGELLTDGEARDRFAVEARLLASLDHPHVVRVYDYVETEEVCALIMERLRGGTIADRRMLVRIGPEAACAITCAVLYGLEHAHRRGALHRDVKPENIMFGERDLIKVTDFGIAKVLSAGGARLTATAGTLGTPAYMAPEQVRRSVGPLSPATDVWAVGAVIYELLADQPPFPRSGDLGEVLVQRITEEAVPLSETAPQIPSAVAAVVMQALDREPAARFATAAQFAEALEQAAAEGFGTNALAATAIPIHRSEPAPTASSEPTIAEPGEVVTPPPQGRSSRAKVIAAIAAVAAGAAIAVVLLSRGEDGAPDSGDEGAPITLPPPPEGLPPAPEGWPDVVSIGFSGTLGGLDATAVLERTGEGGMTTEVFAGDATSPDLYWLNDPTVSPRTVVSSAVDGGVLPFLGFYIVRGLGREGQADVSGRAVMKTLDDPKLMRDYWRVVRTFLKQVGSAGGPVAISVEPSVWSELSVTTGAPGHPEDIPVQVAASGYEELAGLTDDLRGFAAGWAKMRDRYAPEAMLSYVVDDYGTGVDISAERPTEASLRAHARGAAAFVKEIGVRSFDLASLEISFKPEGSPGVSPSEAYSEAEKQNVLLYVEEFVKQAGLPIVLDGIGAGNTQYRTIDNTQFHYSDTWVEWLLGDPEFTNLQAMRDAGVIGIQLSYGVSAEQQTCPCDAAGDGVTNGAADGLKATSADDDGGYFAERMDVLVEAGHLAVP